MGSGFILGALSTPVRILKEFLLALVYALPASKLPVEISTVYLLLFLWYGGGSLIPATPPTVLPFLLLFSAVFQGALEFLLWVFKLFVDT